MTIIAERAIAIYISVHGEVTEERWEEARNVAPYPIDITLPCGNSIKCVSVDELPKHNVPCPCGNPKHWLVYYDREGD